MSTILHACTKIKICAQLLAITNEPPLSSGSSAPMGDAFDDEPSDASTLADVKTQSLRTSPKPAAEDDSASVTEEVAPTLPDDGK